MCAFQPQYDRPTLGYGEFATTTPAAIFGVVLSLILLELLKGWLVGVVGIQPFILTDMPVPLCFRCNKESKSEDIGSARG